MASTSSFPVSSYFFQTIMNKLWLGFDLTEAIAAPILHVNGKGHVEYEPKFNQVRLKSHLLPETPATQCLLLQNPVTACARQVRFIFRSHKALRSPMGKAIGWSHGSQVREQAVGWASPRLRTSKPCPLYPISKKPFWLWSVGCSFLVIFFF